MTTRNYENIPNELKQLNQWIVFHVYPDPVHPGKMLKIPYIAQPGFAVKASSTNAATWRTYAQALEACNTPDYHLGLALTAFDPYCVIDLDVPLNDEVKKQHQDTLGFFADTYQEKSVSGNGYHIICKAPAANGVKSTPMSMEIYTQERMIVFTGDVLVNAPIKDHSLAVEQLTAYLRGKSESAIPAASYDEVVSDMTPSDVVRITCEQHNYQSAISRLCSGNFTEDDYAAGFSETTGKIMIALACESRIRDSKLLAEAFFTTDWFNSVVYQQHYAEHNRHKIDKAHAHWKRESTSAIARAVSLVGAKDQAAQIANGLLQQDVDAFKQAQQSAAISLPHDLQQTARISEPVPFPYIKTKALAWQHPPGPLLTGMIEFYMAASQRPNRSVALAGALATLSGWAGRQYQTNTKAGLTFYGLMFGKSGNGKNDADRGYYTLSEALKNSANRGTMVPFLEAHTGPGKTTGDAAFRRNMFRVYGENNESVSRVHFFKEVGHMLNASKSGESSLGMIPFLLEAFGSSGRYERLQEKEFAMVENNVGEMKAANIAFLGEGTRESIFGNLNIEDVSSGLLPRFCFIDCGDEKPRRNKDVMGWQNVPESLLSACTVLINNVKKMEDNNEFYFVQKTPDAENWLDNMCDSIDDYTDDMEEYNPNRAMLGRYHLIVERLCAIAAISKNPTLPVADMECVTWAQAFMMNSYRVAMTCIDQDMSPLGEQRYTTVVTELVRYFDLKTVGKTKADLRVKKLVENGFIQWSAFRRNLPQWKGFKEESAIRFKRPAQLLNEVFKEMEADGIVIKSNQLEARTILAVAPGGEYYRLLPEGLAMLNNYLQAHDEEA